MFRLLFWILAAACMAPPAHAQLQEEDFRQCAADGDCAIMHGLCGAWTAVNEARQADAEAFYAEKHQMVLCEWSNTPKPEKAECRNHKCAIPDDDR